MYAKLLFSAAQTEDDAASTSRGDDRKIRRNKRKLMRLNGWLYLIRSQLWLRVVFSISIASASSAIGKLSNECQII